MSGRTPAMADSLEIKGLFLYKYIYTFFFSLSVTFFSIAFYNTSYQIKKKKVPSFRL